LWRKSLDFVGWEIDVQGFVIGCIGLWKVPAILEAHPVPSICLKHALQFLALVIQALNMACLVCEAILADVSIISNASWRCVHRRKEYVLMSY